MLISNSRFSRRGPALHRPEGKSFGLSAELAGEGSLEQLGLPTERVGHVQRLVGLSCVAHFTLQTLASLPRASRGNP